MLQETLAKHAEHQMTAKEKRKQQADLIAARLVSSLFGCMLAVGLGPFNVFLDSIGFKSGFGLRVEDDLLASNTEIQIGDLAGIHSSFLGS